jgi:hypothetical protein
MVDGFDAIRAAPRPALAGKAERALDSLSACGPLLGRRLAFWPQLAATVERLTSSIGGAPLLGNLRNVAAVMRHLPDASRGRTAPCCWARCPQRPSRASPICCRRRRAASPRRDVRGRVPTFFDLSAARGSGGRLEHIAGGHLSLALTLQPRAWAGTTGCRAGPPARPTEHRLPAPQPPPAGELGRGVRPGTRAAGPPGRRSAGPAGRQHVGRRRSCALALDLSGNE